LEKGLALALLLAAMGRVAGDLNKAMLLIKRPLLKALIGKENELNLLKRNVFQWSRAKEAADAALAAAAASGQCTVVGNPSKGRFDCEVENDKRIRWGFPLLGHSFAPLELALLWATLFLMVGYGVGLYLASLLAEKRAAEARDRTRAAAAAAAEAAKPFKALSPCSIFAPAPDGLAENGSAVVRAPKPVPVQPMPPAPVSNPPVDGTSAMRSCNGISAPTHVAASAQSVQS